MTDATQFQLTNPAMLRHMMNILLRSMSAPAV